MKRRKSKGENSPGALEPPPERRQHDPVERSARAIADESGAPARPFQALDTLARMLRTGTITAAMHQAGEDFRALFQKAQLDPLRAADLDRLPESTRELPVHLRQAEARKKVWRAVQTLGGMSSPAGSCAWHVLGCEDSVRDWALRQGWNGRPMKREAASGILVGTLGMLQAYFGL